MTSTDDEMEVGHVDLDGEDCAVVAIEIKDGYALVTVELSGPASVIKLLFTAEEALRLGGLLTEAGSDVIKQHRRTT
jgi:hypothetical protein